METPLNSQIVPQLKEVETTASFQGYDVTECVAYDGTTFTTQHAKCTIQTVYYGQTTDTVIRRVFLCVTEQEFFLEVF